MSGWGNSDRRSELPPDWAKIRQRILKRDGYRCTWLLPKTGTRCPRPASDVDHKLGPLDHRDSALQSLCREHHDKKTAREAWAGKRRKKPPKRPEEQHPGIRRP